MSNHERSLGRAGLARSAGAFRVLPIPGLALLALASCTSSQPPAPPPPQPAQGPLFVISSPREGATVSGATFFAVQPLHPAEVQRVGFTAGGAELAPDAPGEDAFKVFLVPRDFPNGPLTLRATLTGKDGARSEKSITVNVLADPPSSATVGGAGATLGTREVNGAASTLSIPAGVAEGARVTFTALSKADVKAATGIDYDALGVTFLGAQAISSTLPIAGPVGVSSGGFGPMVQPGQAVLNYLILPDRDGDGIGELVAINGASVAPGGDVISNPVPQIQLGSFAASASGLRAGIARLASAGPLAGPPGKYVEIEASGFNQASLLGNVALFKSKVDGTEIALPAFVVPHAGDPNATPTLAFYIPPLAPGAATVTLRSVSTGATAAPLAVTVEAPPALAKRPAVVIDEAFAQAIGTLSGDPALQGLVTKLGALKSSFASLGSNPSAADAALLEQLAVFLSNSNMGALLSQIAANAGRSAVPARAPGALQAGLPCSLATSLEFEALTAYGGLLGAAALGLFAFATIASLPITAPLGLALLGMTAVAGGIFGVGLGGLFACLRPLPPTPPTPPSLEGCLLPAVPMPPTPAPPTGGLLALAPPPPVTGMGSIVPPGGDGCGSALGSELPASGGLGTRSLRDFGPGSPSRSLSSVLGDQSGRFIVKVFYGSGSSVPFSGVSDASGYFYIPTIPAEQPFEAIAFDTSTGQTRSVKGIGPGVGQSTYLSFDFLSAGTSGGKVIGYGTSTQGVYAGVDIYLLQGRAGDLIHLALFHEVSPLGGVRYQLSDPNGFPLFTGLTSGGHFWETGILELAADGLYTFTVDGSAASGNYTLGLARIEPIAMDMTTPVAAELVALGGSHFYTFTGRAGDVVKMTLSAPVLNARLQLRAPQPGVPFYKQLPVISRLFTANAQRSSSASITLTADGDHVVEIAHERNPFEADLQRYLGTYRLDIAKTP